jgi:hypothetical protein
MVATCVLALSTLLVYEAFFVSLDTFNYCSNYLNIASWMDEKIWQLQDDLTRFGKSDQDMQGTLRINNKDFEWISMFNLIDEVAKLYKLDLTISWQQGKRQVRLSRTAYAMHEPK